MKLLTIFVILLIALSLSSCDGSWDGIQEFAWHLQGTWVSNDPSVYSGYLVISFARITINGFEEGQTPTLGGDDNRRPFRNFIKGVALNGYSEENTAVNGLTRGHIFIEDAGIIQPGIPYTYWYEGSTNFHRTHFLRFNFGGRYETLQRIE